MYSPPIELAYNLAILVAMSSMSGFIRERWKDKVWGGIFQGVLFGAAALIGMMRPLTLGSEGLIFDGRSVVISLCGLFFGPLAVSVAGGMAALYRIMLGGVGVYMGVLVIASSTFLGIVFHYRWIRRGEPLTAGRLLSVGFFVHVVMLLLMFTLPAGKGLATIKLLGLPILLTYPLATLLIGKLLFNQEAGLRSIETLRLTRISIDSASDALFWMTPDARIVDVNMSACRALGYTRDELLNLHVREVDIFYSAETWQKHFSELRKQGTLMFESEHRAKNGKVFPVEIVANYIQVGAEEYNCAFVRDITDRKLAEEERAEMEARLQQSQKMEAIGTLAGGIAHDFNNILSAIFGFSELALVEKDAKILRKDLEQVISAAERAKQLTKQILTISRKTNEEKRPLQVALIINEAMKMLRSSIPATIEIKQDIASKGTVLADPTQIHQIIMNLSTNAYHAMRETGGTLSVSLTEIELCKEDEGYDTQVPGRYLKLEVSDTGCGISPDIKDKIFEPYFTTKKTGEGTGLGLAVVHGIVENYHGHITFNSERGKGTTFQVYLPLAAETATEMTVKEVIADFNGKGAHVLFVDDESQILEFADKLLSMHNYQVTTFRNSVLALEEFENRPGQFDLVITDMTMPYMTGTELAQRILGIKPDMPIILCTGLSDLINREKALAMGICDYLLKPITMHELLSAAHKALEIKRRA